MSKLRKAFYEFILWLAGARVGLNLNRNFLVALISLSARGVVISLFLAALLVVADEAYSLLISFGLEGNADSIICKAALSLAEFNQRFKARGLEYFTDVISIGAGVLGVLLGLFYTAFLTIVATKYSNINTVVSVHLLQQKSLNKYFTLLSSITSLSFVFQFILYLGYKPLIVSSLTYVLIVIFIIASFTRYGRTLHIYFDPSSLAIDILGECYSTFQKALRYKGIISRLSKGKLFIHRIFNDIEKIETIIEESKNPQVSNTSLDIISKQLADFSRYILIEKHKIPSNKQWNIEIVKHKNWEDAREWDFNLVKSTGLDMLRENVTSPFEIEKKIIGTQFKLFESYVTDSPKIDVLTHQIGFVGQLSFHCDNSMFEFYFDKLESFLINRIAKTEDKMFRLQLISVYSNLLTQYFISLNYFVESFDIQVLKQASRSFHNFGNPDQYQVPYYLRAAGDEYQVKLLNEKEIEGKVITKEFNSEFELGYVTQYTIQAHYEFISKYSIDRVTRTIEQFQSNDPLLALILSMDSIVLQRKIRLFINSVARQIELLNEVNFNKEGDPFKFKSQEKLIALCEGFNKSILDSIWSTGLSSFDLKHKDLPDVFGKYYQITLDDLLNKLLTIPLDSELILKRIAQYLDTSLLYIRQLREKYKDVKIEFYTTRLFPAIVDLFEVQAIIFIVARSHRKEEFINAIYSFWDGKYKSPVSESKFWEFLHAIYSYGKGPLFALSTNSYIKEHQRNSRMIEYLKDNSILKEDLIKENHFPFMRRTVSTIDDYYLQAIADSTHVDYFNNIELDEVFIEIFLRGRISLKNSKIKATRYGERIK